MKIEIDYVRENATTEDVAAFLRYALFPSDEEEPIENPFRIDLIERYGSELVAYASDGRALRIFVTENIPVAERPERGETTFRYYAETREGGEVEIAYDYVADFVESGGTISRRTA